MSQLAKKVGATLPTGALNRPSAPGPRNKCFPLYGVGDLDDWTAVEALRETEELEWREVQSKVDGLLGITKPLPLEKFRRHFRRRCNCWPEDLKL